MRWRPTAWGNRKFRERRNVRSRMRWRRFGASLALLSLILAGCARWIPAPAPVRLPEPQLPACLVEEAPEGRQVVGVYQFSPSWIDSVRALDGPDEKTRAALLCTVDTARVLREAVTAIRENNRR